MKLRKKIAKALEQFDSTSEGYPDYDELARVAIKAVRKALKYEQQR